MKVTPQVVGLAFVLSSSPAIGGGLFLPGSGAISTSRAGAAVASAADGEALSLNPAGLAKSSGGTSITLSAAIISYSMEFTRRGTYDALPDDDRPYEGQAYPTVKNQPDLPLGIGSYQPVPVIAVVTDLGGVAGGKLKVAAGLYAPNAYPFRDMNNIEGREYTFNGDFNAPPPPTRYDIVTQEAAVILPSLAAAYRITPQLDVGARLSAGFAEIKSQIAVWGEAGNVIELVDKDTLFTVDAKDKFIPAFGLGVAYRPTRNLEVAANYSSQVTIHAKGEATNLKGPGVALNNNPIEIGPISDSLARCETGGNFEQQKVCVDFALPQMATLGARYVFLGANDTMRGDLELNVGWENWAADLVGRYRVVVDAAVYFEGEELLPLRDNVVEHGSRDVFTARLGGSYHVPVGGSTIILRGGVGHDTAYARDGWLRADIDGAARTTMTLGASFRAKRFQVDIGGGYVHEGTPTNDGECNVVSSAPPDLGCANDGNERPVEDRRGADPIYPLSDPDQQFESPVTLGTYKSHYVLLMLGVSTWF